MPGLNGDWIPECIAEHLLSNHRVDAGWDLEGDLLGIGDGVRIVEFKVEVVIYVRSFLSRNLEPGLGSRCECVQLVLNVSLMFLAMASMSSLVAVSWCWSQ